jgi:cysteine-rich repeat protein
MIRYLLVLIAALALHGTPAGATIADDICAFTDDPCVLEQGRTFVVDDDSVLDFEGRTFVLPGSGTILDIESGRVRILAGRLIINAGSAIIGAGGTLEIQTIGDIEVLAATSNGRIDLSDQVAPGALALSTTGGGDVIVQGVVASRGTTADAGLGLIDIASSGDIFVGGEVTGRGGALGDGGEIIMNAAGAIIIPGVIDATGGEGGSIDMSAETITTIVGSGFPRLDARAVAGAGFGGAIDLFAFGPITLATPVQVQGEPGLDIGGDGGDVAVTAGQDLTITAPVNLFGTIPDGFGGTADFVSGGSILMTGAIDATGKRTFGAGGSVTFFAQENLTLGSIDAGGQCESCIGGEVEAKAWCDLSMPSGRTIGTTGLEGRVAIEAGGAITVAGTVSAGDDFIIRYRPGSPTPNLTGAVLQPAPAVIPDEDVVQCGGPPVPTCGNGTLETGEECDDGNQADCDRCSRTCRDEVCGNGRIDCIDATNVDEVCDDGNTLGCDGCSATCERREGVCGDGDEECGEECDDGNVVSCDVTNCSSTCRDEFCGNGRAECDEECDGGAACDANCERLPPPGCGNGEQTPDEECDDNNTADCDGCNSFCEEERCGDGVRECLEQCDDFNTDPCDGCNGTCRVEECGNGTVDCGEGCDEGALNGEPGSSCLPIVCVPGSICTSEGTGPCIPCADATDCDPLGLCGGRACDVGICEPVTTDCEDSNPCTTDTCDALTGCGHTLLDPTTVPECDDGDQCTTPTCDLEAGCEQQAVEGFDSVRCRFATLGDLLGDDSVSEKARTQLTKLLDKATAFVDKAEDQNASGPSKKVTKSLKKARKKVTATRKKAEKLAGGQLGDLNVARAIINAADDASNRIETLMTGLQS